MDGSWAVYSAAVALGAAHALEVDHMVAVTAFVGDQPRLSAAAGFGLRWGFGHAAVVLVVGGVMAWLGLRLPPSLTVWAEAAVGLMLITIGVWMARRAARLHLHAPGGHGDHVHLHAHAATAAAHEHPHGPRRKARHRHVSTLIGAVHGLAGTVPVVALLPVALLPDVPAALAYLAAFGAGTVVAMAAYAVLAALAVRRTARSPRGARFLAFGTAAASAAVGLWWIARAAL